MLFEVFSAGANPAPRGESAVYGIAGRRVATPVDAELTAGRYEVTWECGVVPSGVYLFRLETADDALVKRLVISR